MKPPVGWLAMRFRGSVFCSSVLVGFGIVDEINPALP